MARLLVTGGAGFIGSNFVRYWRERTPGDMIVVLDALTYAGNPENLAGVPDIEFVHGDIRDEALVEKLLVEHRLDTLVHFAAESHVDRSIAGPDAFVETNIVGAHALLKAARKAWLDTGSGRPHRFHNVSTDEVFGSLAPHDPPFHEGTPYRPNSPYSASKAAADHLVQAYHATYGLQTSTSHCSNNYGPFQFPEKLIPFMLIAALEGRPLPIYGDGLNVRDWLHVEDHCEGIALILDGGRPGGRYAIGGGAELPNMAVVDALCERVDAAFAARPELARLFPQAPAARGAPTASLKRHVADRPGHDRRYAVDCSLIRGELGYAPRRAFAAGLAATIDWYLAHEGWWRRVLTGAYRDWLSLNYEDRAGAS
ncbi:MAG TPA: dTDP-glucose 4,6-dehydratase [Sphingomonas sp.]|nr:dTDP-glucose 4,6-dehydratase [Sphingomonas sp.]